MTDLILQTIKETDLDKAISILKSRNLFTEDKKCPICESKIEHIGGFLPQSGKVMPICDAVSCTLQASFLVMKYNGNGSPIIEE